MFKQLSDDPTPKLFSIVYERRMDETNRQRIILFFVPLYGVTQFGDPFLYPAVTRMILLSLALSLLLHEGDREE